MSLWDEQRRLLEQNLKDVLKRPSGSVNRHALEAIIHRNIQNHVENICASAYRGRHIETYEAWKSALSDTKELRDKPYLYEHLHCGVNYRLK